MPKFAGTINTLFAMKYKHLLFIAFALLAAGLVSCSSDKEDEEDPTSPSYDDPSIYTYPMDGFDYVAMSNRYVANGTDGESVAKYNSTFSYSTDISGMTTAEITVNGLHADGSMAFVLNPSNTIIGFVADDKYYGVSKTAGTYSVIEDMATPQKPSSDPGSSKTHKLADQSRTGETGIAKEILAFRKQVEWASDIYSLEWDRVLQAVADGTVKPRSEMNNFNGVFPTGRYFDFWIKVYAQEYMHSVYNNCNISLEGDPNDGAAIWMEGNNIVAELSIQGVEEQTALTGKDFYASFMLRNGEDGTESTTNLIKADKSGYCRMSFDGSNIKPGLYAVTPVLVCEDFITDKTGIAFWRHMAQTGNEATFRRVAGEARISDLWVENDMWYAGKIHFKCHAEQSDAEQMWGIEILAITQHDLEEGVYTNARKIGWEYAPQGATAHDFDMMLVMDMDFLARDFSSFTANCCLIARVISPYGPLTAPESVRFSYSAKPSITFTDAFVDKTRACTTCGHQGTITFTLKTEGSLWFDDNKIKPGDYLLAVSRWRNWDDRAVILNEHILRPFNDGSQTYESDLCGNHMVYIHSATIEEKGHRPDTFDFKYFVGGNERHSNGLYFKWDEVWEEYEDFGEIKKVFVGYEVNSISIVK